MVSRLPHVIDRSSQLPSRGSCPSKPEAPDSRTPLAPWLRAIAPVAVVLSMSAFTLVTIVLIVTTVAQAIPQSEGGHWHRISPWSRWDSSPKISVGDSGAPYLDLAPLNDPAPAQSRVDTAYTTSWMSEQ